MICISGPIPPEEDMIRGVNSIFNVADALLVLVLLSHGEGLIELLGAFGEVTLHVGVEHL